MKREEEAAEGGEGAEGWPPAAKKRRASDEDDAPKKHALRAHLALQLTHHTAKVTLHFTLLTPMTNVLNK
jgi:hypothetical protein